MTTPIKDDALIGNCETAALINPNGGIDWLCLPAFDAGSFFGALVDEEKGGRFSVQPSGPFRVESEYLDDSAILQTRFITDCGVVKLTDFFRRTANRRARRSKPAAQFDGAAARRSRRARYLRCARVSFESRVLGG
jgi:GH15 family glucan-1,4-alpha-glucosidase